MISQMPNRIQVNVTRLIINQMQAITERMGISGIHGTL